MPFASAPRVRLCVCLYMYNLSLCACVLVNDETDGGLQTLTKTHLIQNKLIKWGQVMNKTSLIFR